MAAKPRPVRLPWDPVDLTPSELASIKAVADGVAESEQQRIAFRTIVHKLCRVDRMSFTAFGPEEGKRATDFAEGCRWVGNTMRFDIVGREYPVNPRGAPPPMPAAETAVSESSKPGEP
jgi:hypothetical protein